MEEVQAHVEEINVEKDAAMGLAEEEAERAAAAEASVEQTGMILEDAEQKMQMMVLQVKAAHEQLRLMELEHKVVPLQELEAIRSEVGRLEETYHSASSKGIAEATMRGEARVEEVRVSAEAAVSSLRRALAEAQSSAVSTSTSFYEAEIHSLQSRLEREVRECAASQREADAAKAMWEARTLRAEQELENERSSRRIAEASSAQLVAASAGLIPSQKGLEQEVQTLATRLVRTQSESDGVKRELSSESVKVHELQLRLEAEVRTREATEASLADMTRGKQLAEDRIVGATLRLERETLLRMEEQATSEKIVAALTEQLATTTADLQADLAQVKADAEATLDEVTEQWEQQMEEVESEHAAVVTAAKKQLEDVTMAAAQMMHEQEQLEELSVTTALHLEAETDVHTRAKQEVERLQKAQQLARETKASLEAALAKYDNDLAIELTFRSKAERSLNLAVDRMNSNHMVEMRTEVFYAWARRTAARSYMRKREGRVGSLAAEHAQARAFAAWLSATQWSSRAEQLMGRGMVRMSQAVTRNALDVWIESTAITSHKTHGTARAARMFKRRAQMTAFAGWAEVTAETYRLIHISTKVIATMRNSRVLKILSEWRAWATYERNSRAEAQIMMLRGEHSVEMAARAAAEARAAKAEAAVDREKSARIRRVEMRREMRAATVVQRWYRRLVQAKLATDDDLYAFLRAEGMVEYEPRLRAESVDLATLKELEVDDLKHFGVPIGPARRIVNTLARTRAQDLGAVVRMTKVVGEEAMDWMKHKIHVDDKATLRPPSMNPKESELELRPRAKHDWLDSKEHPSVVRYIGRIGKRKGLYVGLELLDYSEGMVAGELDGVRYFR